MNTFRHVDLFAGIGGFTIAAEAAGWDTIAFSEINPYANKILKKRWPHIPNFGSIIGAPGMPCDLVTGGFPCQPYSISGPQLGADDDRDLWDEMCGFVDRSRPTWIVGENSPQILNMVFDKIKTDLEAINYQVGPPLIIPACGVNADHRRERAWICAYSNTGRLQGVSPKAFQGLTSLPLESAGVFESERSRRSISKPGMLRSYHGLPTASHQIKCLGNAVVPHIPERILRAIKMIHEKL